MLSSLREVPKDFEGDFRMQHSLLNGAFYSVLHIKHVWNLKHTHPDSYDWLRRSHITQFCSSSLQLLHSMVALVGVALAYPQHTLTATPTCSSHSGTVLHETYIAG